MATLIEDVDAAETDWLVSADIPNGTDYLTVGSEIVMISARFPTQPDPQTRLPVSTRLRVERAAGGTTAATHSNGATLTPLIPPSSGAGGGAIPDPTTGADGDVPLVTSGAYALGPPSYIQNEDGSVVVMARATDLETIVGDDARVNVAVDGTILINNAAGSITIFPNGSIELQALTDLITVNGSTFAGDGSVSLAAGIGVFGADGAVDINGKLEVTAGGDVDIGNGSMTLATGGADIVMNAGVVKMSSLPTADPVAAGALWIDTAAGRVLKVSAG